MSRHRDEVSLRQMLDHAREAAGLVRGLTRDDLDRDRVRLLALLQLLQIVGEAARRVSPERQVNLPEIPWPQIIAFRNRLVHGYDAVDYEALWQIVSNDVPQLIAVLEKASASGPRG
jgi:uncharacterized protein with HEPN domain